MRSSLPHEFDAIPSDARAQATLAFEHLAQALAASGCEPQHVVMMTRYFTDIAADQDAVNACLLYTSGTDSGSSVFVGVSNSHRMLKQGDMRDYTVGFRTADPVITGTISYEP